MSPRKTERSGFASSVASVLSKMTHKGYRDQGTPLSDEGTVWGLVSEELDLSDSFSDTSALHAVYVHPSVAYSGPLRRTKQQHTKRATPG